MIRRRWIDSVKKWCGMDSVAERRPSRTKPCAIDEFIERTRIASPSIYREMGDLMNNEGITPQQFADFCLAFAQGAKYVADRFGTVPSRIDITDESRSTPQYNVDSHVIQVPREFIANCIKTKVLRQSKTEPFLLTDTQMATMYGVEEAYHHYDVTTFPGRYEPSKMCHPNGTSDYDRSPLESSAKVVVREALRDFGMLNNPIAEQNVNLEDIQWMESMRRNEAKWKDMHRRHPTKPTGIVPRR